MRATTTGVLALVWVGIGSGMPAAAQLSAEQQQKAPPSAITLESPALGANKPGAESLKAGANSFAEGQARALIEAKGFTNVSALMNDSKGIWRGTATRGNEKVDVSVDVQGKVAASPPDTAKEAKP